MDNTYYFETINDCEKQIIDKTINLDIMYTSCCNLFECFTRTVRTIFIWFLIIDSAIGIYKVGFKSYVKPILIYILIYVLGMVLMSWVRYNHNRMYANAKTNLVDGIIGRCKEYQETNYEEWQKKQILKRFANLANININWDNVK